MKSKVIAVVISLVCMFLPALNPAGTLYAGQPRALTDSTEGLLLTQVWNVTSSASVALGDIDEDGSLDALIAAAGHKTWLNDGDGNFTASDLGLPPGSMYVVALADVNKDMHVDAVVGGFIAEHSSGVWLNDGTGHFQFTQELVNESTEVYTGLAVGDLNKDGYPELVLSGGEGGFGTSRSFLWLNDGTGHFTRSILLPDGPMAFGDVNGDTDVDLLVGVEGAPDTIQLWTNTGTGMITHTAQIALSGVCRLVNGGLALGDTDHDTDLDLVVADPLCSNDAFWVNDGLGHFQNSGQTESGLATTVALSDFNQDGNLDALLGGKPSVLWLNDEHGNFTRSQTIGSTYVETLAVGDVNGDDHPDAFVARSLPSYDNSSGIHLWQWVTTLHNFFLPLTPSS